MINTHIITMTAYRRPEYTKRVVESLLRCIGINKYTILANIEPGHNDVIKIFDEVHSVACIPTINSSVQGCSHNTYLALSKGFERSDYVVHLEDDTVLSRDALLYFEHCFNAYSNDSSVYTVLAYNKTQPTIDRSLYYKIRKNPWFTPWGWATWKDRFNDMEIGWDHGISKGGWDQNLNHNLRLDRVEIIPFLGRCQNIGEKDGTYCTAEHHRLNQFNEFWAGTIEEKLNGGTFHE